MNQDKLKSALEFAKANGLKSIEIDGIKMEVGSPIPEKIEVVIQNEDELKKAFSSTPFDDLTDEEVLFAATPYFDELQEQKKAKQAALLKEEQVKEHKDVKNG